MTRRLMGGAPIAARKSFEDYFAAISADPIARAFSGKRAIHPFLDAEPVPEDMWSDTWREIVAAPREGKSVAYFHIPFCENHCLFCGFYQNPWREESCRAYTDVLVEELRRCAGQPVQMEGPVHAVYFGGGTPSALEARDLERLLLAVREYLPLAPDCEITIEGRVHSFSPDKARACFDAGANRISLGVQSFDEKLRRGMGRKRSRREVLEFLDTLVALDAGAIVIDLIYGFPDQTLEGWEEDVRMGVEIGLDGIDLYALNLIPGTPLQMAIDRGKYDPAIPGDQLGRYYELGCDVMEQAGWETISTTHWRRSTRERNLYNLLVKAGANCLAFGAGAGGSLGGYNFRTQNDLKSYLEHGSGPEKLFRGILKQPSDSHFLARIKGEMELGRLNINLLKADLKRLYKLDFDTLVLPLLDQWRSAGLLTIGDDRLDLTRAGRFWQVKITGSLIEWLSHITHGGVQTPAPE